MADVFPFCTFKKEKRKNISYPEMWESLRPGM
jgi:hypothetical protein